MSPITEPEIEIVPTTRLTIPGTFTQEFIDDLGADGVMSSLLGSLDSWARKRGYVRAEIDDIQLRNITESEDDRADLVRQHLQRWRIWARYRTMTHAEDKARG